MIDAETELLQIGAALATKAEPGKEDLDRRLSHPIADHQYAAPRAERLVDQPGRRRPVRVIERRCVQRTHYRA